MAATYAGGVTDWIYVSEIGSIERRSNPTDSGVGQVRSTNTYTRYRVGKNLSAFTLELLRTTPNTNIKSSSGTTIKSPENIGGAFGNAYECISHTFELIEPGSDMIKETEIWKSKKQYTTDFWGNAF
ncbi:MAG: hypothetical protein OEN49_08715 [Gammaproteobacteria bacterium]|nr:hypothetical protein [Gammaproteobacteria bacterium]